ncbi:HIT family protein [Streptococcus halichoeri]|uniref:HIT family protein n=1 Tax=Streptococcus halichoeri TaxID=254785 RepID=UPI00135BB666|nr:HIT family protein [Streptococcus halichoeri]
MNDCIFCKIIAGEIPASKVYEDDQVLAFLDITQTTKGHTLLVPKKHVRNVLAMDAETAKTTFARLPKIARGLQKATGAQAMNIINNNEPLAGQTVFHAHIHLVPRYSNKDGIDIRYTTHEPDFAALESLAKTISKEVALCD